MELTGLRQIAVAGLVLATSACGGRALLEDGVAAGGQSGTLGTAGGHPDAAGGETSPQGGAPVVTSGGASDAGVGPVTNAECPGLAANPPTACSLDPADVSCVTNQQCTTLVVLSSATSCLRLVYGLNSASVNFCQSPPQEGACASFQNQTQDCRITDGEQPPVFALCTNGRCTSYTEVFAP
jgi:hypothetical protein